jgi:hypothetical protein
VPTAGPGQAVVGDEKRRVGFSDDQIEAHLKRLVDDQEDDGGWSLS